ncbi:hypothetical protein [Pantoea allii]|uniref:hypothetical protein n=1 Tax=Pantoea allii TaxID=574096 RepID=UPI000A2593E2|nr:hypothetical protein [Pantoea allii]MBW1251772.1 hypothetical protein [Pantoea allii]MBW1260369.1 hypothetical protein [Pantoea allii]MBW1282966.1 hypothetical protein [Pantoea allii]ORM88987.1 hypothetical protein HA38_01065 [Pantoea allii]PBJ98898.1 hypothetical protein CMR03_19595 [Pantoea allii]
MKSKIVVLSTFLMITGCTLNRGHVAQLTCDNFENLAKCMDQARARGLTDVGIGDVGRSVGLVDGWAGNMKADQLLVGEGAFPREVLRIDQDIAAMMPEGERILKTGDWAKYPAWRTRYVHLSEKLYNVKLPAAQRAYDNAASARAEGFHTEATAPAAQQQECYVPIGVGPEGPIMGMGPCN